VRRALFCALLGVAKMTDGGPKAPEAARDEAIGWWLRRADGPLSEKDRTAFEAWLEAAAANRRAYEKLSRIGSLIEARRGGGEPRRRKRRTKAAAAGILGAVLLLVFYDDLSLAVRSDYRTGTGETQRLTLADGSLVELAPRSAIAVRYDPGQRRLVLLAGEAWYEAAPDPARPFRVEAAGGSVTALGTAFDVALDHGLAQVTVTQHRVTVSSGGNEVIVGEGRRARFAPGTAASRPEPVDVGQATAWRRGKLIFAAKPLAEVVEALGRYHRGYIVIPDRSVRARPVSGVFTTGDPLAALDEIETSLGLHTARLTDYLVVI
jgi:transmembrane sensor